MLPTYLKIMQNISKHIINGIDHDKKDVFMLYFVISGIENNV